MSKKVPKIVKYIQENPPKPINYNYQKNISFSQMSVYRGCNHRWKLQYKDKLKSFTSSIHTVFGTAVHEVIQHYLDIMYSKSGVKADELDLEDMLYNSLVSEYKAQLKENNGEHFIAKEDLEEFYEDGVKILTWFRKNRSKYFSKRGYHLVGCEIPIINPPTLEYPNILFLGYLDVVIYHEPTDTFHIIDIKTSTKGWRDQDKKNEEKQYQLLLYKTFFSTQYNIPLNKIKIEFFILKRKVLDADDENLMSPYQSYRVQQFTPPSGKIKLKRAQTAVTDFITECFNKSGDINGEREYKANPSKWNCRFCSFSKDVKNCGKGINF